MEVGGVGGVRLQILKKIIGGRGNKIVAFIYSDFVRGRNRTCVLNQWFTVTNILYFTYTLFIRIKLFLSLSNSYCDSYISIVPNNRSIVLNQKYDPCDSYNRDSYKKVYIVLFTFEAKGGGVDIRGMHVL